jgi:hypothetical protein
LRRSAQCLGYRLEIVAELARRFVAVSDVSHLLTGAGADGGAGFSILMSSSGTPGAGLDGTGTAAGFCWGRYSGPLVPQAASSQPKPTSNAIDLRISLTLAAKERPQGVRGQY